MIDVDKIGRSISTSKVAEIFRKYLQTLQIADGWSKVNQIRTLVK